jgi:hypothetical protein
MKLRYLHIQNLPPLEDVTLHFGHEAMLGRQCAIHFVVGVNGSGKSRLLLALAEIVLALEARRWPAFPFSIVYDRGGVFPQTVAIHKPNHGSQGAYFATLRALPENPYASDPPETWADWLKLHPQARASDSTLTVSEYPDGYLPDSTSMATLLPVAVLAATSGVTQAWEELLDRYEDTETQADPSLPTLPEGLILSLKSGHVAGRLTETPPPDPGACASPTRGS